MAEKKKKIKWERVVTPPCVAMYAWLDKPDGKYAKAGTEGDYKITMLWDDTPEVRDWIDKIIDAAKAKSKEEGIKLTRNAKSPFTYPEDHEDEDFVVDPETGKSPVNEAFRGKIYATAKSRFQPGQIDTKRQSLPEGVFIGGGDVVQVKIQPEGYPLLGSGVTLKLVTVMLCEKNTAYSGGADTDGFGDYEGGYVAPEGSDNEEDDENF